jgi:hypothetical protein
VFCFVDSEPWNTKLHFVDRPQGRCRQVASKTRFPPETRALPPQQTDEGRAGRDKLGCFPCDAPRPVHESEDAVNHKTTYRYRALLNDLGRRNRCSFVWLTK